MSKRTHQGIPQSSRASKQLKTEKKPPGRPRKVVDLSFLDGTALDAETKERIREVLQDWRPPAAKFEFLGQWVRDQNLRKLFRSIVSSISNRAPAGDALDKVIKRAWIHAERISELEGIPRPSLNAYDLMVAFVVKRYCRSRKAEALTEARSMINSRKAELKRGFHDDSDSRNKMQRLRRVIRDIEQLSATERPLPEVKWIGEKPPPGDIQKILIDAGGTEGHYRFTADHIQVLKTHLLGKELKDIAEVIPEETDNGGRQWGNDIETIEHVREHVLPHLKYCANSFEQILDPIYEQSLRPAALDEFIATALQHYVIYLEKQIKDDAHRLFENRRNRLLDSWVKERRENVRKKLKENEEMEYSFFGFIAGEAELREIREDLEKQEALIEAAKKKKTDNEKLDALKELKCREAYIAERIKGFQEDYPARSWIFEESMM